MARRRSQSVVLGSNADGDDDTSSTSASTWDVKRDLESVSINVKDMASGFKGNSGVESAVQLAIPFPLNN